MQTWVSEHQYAPSLEGGTVGSLSASMNIDWGEYMAVGTMAVMPIMIFTLVLQRHLVRGLTFGAVR